MNTRKIETLKISDDMRAKLEALTDAPRHSIDLTDEQKAIIIEYYPKKKKDELATLLGVSKSYLTQKYNDLVKDEKPEKML